jgi:hypothetical protein
MNMSIEEIITELSMTYSFQMHLILEGDDDRKFFKSALTGKDKVNFICAWGADSVTELVQRIDVLRTQGKFTPTLGVIDRDYRIALGTLHASPNLLVSDFRDIECMMFGSPALEAVLSEFGSAAKILALGGAASIAALALGAASEIGKLRFFSQKAGVAASFKKLDIGRLVDRKTLMIKAESLVAHLDARQGVEGNPFPANAIVASTAACAAAKCDQGNPYFTHPLLLCRGHDLMEVLAIGFRSLFGTRSAAESSRENIETLFRLGYVPHFRAAQLGHSLDAWLKQHGLHPQISLV